MIFYKTGISVSTNCPTALKCIKTAIMIAKLFGSNFNISINFKQQLYTLEHCDVDNRSNNILETSKYWDTQNIIKNHIITIFHSVQSSLLALIFQNNV